MEDGTSEIIGACIEVHRHLGPGLLESVYEDALAHELQLRGLGVSRQVQVPLEYKGRTLGTPLRIDLVVEPRPGKLLRQPTLLELKAVENFLPIHDAQVVTYLKLARLPVGLLVNFNVHTLRRGIRRFVNG